MRPGSMCGSTTTNCAFSIAVSGGSRCGPSRIGSGNTCPVVSHAVSVMNAEAYSPLRTVATALISVHLAGLTTANGTALVPDRPEAREHRRWLAADWLRGVAAGEPKQALKGSPRCPSSVEPELELAEVCRDILGADAVVSPGEPRLEVREDSVDARQDLARVSLASLILRLVVI